MKISGRLVDVVQGRIYPANIYIEDGVIKHVEEVLHAPKKYILPGLVDSHIHIESSMLVPAEFARLAVVHGTIATVSDPHEIANVCGLDGVHYMLESASKSTFYFNFGAPSCVPATKFETAGAYLGPDEVEKLLTRDDILYLSELMNFPGVLDEDEEVMYKIQAAKKLNKPIDGHAPGLLGKEAKYYFEAGISTEHECFTYNEGLEKAELGVKILIREGSAAKNYDALIELLPKFPNQIMFCSDDKHPDALVQDHIDELIRRSIQNGFDQMQVIRAATLNPVKHYGLKHGLVQENDSANFIIVDDLEEFRVLETWIKGEKVAEKGKTLLRQQPAEIINNFNAIPISEEDLKIEAITNKVKIIEVKDGQLITNEIIHEIKVENGFAGIDIEKDILKIVVLNRYKPSRPAVAFVKGFGLKKGAIASTVAHDSHNIIAVGVDDNSIQRAINLLIQNKGGIAVTSDILNHVLPLPVAGLMSDCNGYEVASKYSDMDRRAKSLGSKLSAPFMTLSFLALLVIPQLKLSDKGLFDGKKFSFTQLFV